MSLLLILIPGGMQLTQVVVETLTETKQFVDNELTISRVALLASSVFGSIAQAVYGISCSMYPLLSRIFIVGSALNIASVILNIFLLIRSGCVENSGENV